MIPSDESTLLRLHHVGFVVASIEDSVRGFARSLEASWDEVVFTDPEQRVKVTFLRTAPEDALVELVEPNGEDAPVNLFLKKNGPGLHHLCYEVKGLEESIKELRTKGALLAKPPKPAVAFGGRRIAWLLTAEKLLVELLEIEKR